MTIMVSLTSPPDSDSDSPAADSDSALFAVSTQFALECHSSNTARASSASLGHESIPVAFEIHTVTRLQDHGSDS